MLSLPLDPQEWWDGQAYTRNPQEEWQENHTLWRTERQSTGAQVSWEGSLVLTCYLWGQLSSPRQPCAEVLWGRAKGKRPPPFPGEAFFREGWLLSSCLLESRLIWVLSSRPLNFLTFTSLKLNCNHLYWIYVILDGEVKMSITD